MLEQQQGAEQLGRVLFQLENVGLDSYEGPLFRNVSFSIIKGQSVALTGESGSGKTRLLQVLTGRETPIEGQVNVFGKDIRISYVPQEIEDLGFENSTTVKELFWQARKLNEIEKEMTHLEASFDKGFSQSDLDRYGDLQSEYERRGGWQAEPDVERILRGLGLAQHINLDTKLDEVSSGQKTLLLIAQALFSQADLIVFDDPTRHLDIQRTKWLSDYLKTTGKASIVATNDHNFLNTFANKVVELTPFGRAIIFEGNWEEFVEKRSFLVKTQKGEREKLLQAINAKRRQIQHYKDWGIGRSEETDRQRKIAERELTDLETQLSQLPQPFYETKKIKPQCFEFSRPGGSDVLTIKQVKKSFGDIIAVDLPQFETVMRRKETILISGGNGSGKSTLLKIITGQLSPDEGTVVQGASLDINYYEPGNSCFKPEETPIEAMRRLGGSTNDQKAAAILAYWGIDSRKAYARRMELMTAGEKAQVALVAAMLKPSNLLILDEPTVDLSSQMIDRLTLALNSYKGTKIIVSHNPKFLEQLTVSRELQLPQGKIILK